MTVDDYEKRQRAFHAALAAEPPAGFRGSFSVALSRAPWAAGGGDAYGDWYFVDDFATLGTLNEAAITGSRHDPHQAAAAAAEGGTAGVYGLRLGAALLPPRHAVWLSKPQGMRYAEMLVELKPLVEKSRGALWMRQMTLGPAREFSLHMATAVEVPRVFSPLVVPVRRVWPEAARS